jgi:dUTPase
MNILIKNIKGLQVPQKAHKEDAFYDLSSTSEPIIIGEFIERFDGMKLYNRIQYIEYQTNLAVAHENDKNYIQIYPRSSISNKNLVLANSVGIIDNGYRNFIALRFKYVIQPEDMVQIQEAGMNKTYCIINQDLIYQNGDKVAQLGVFKTIDINFKIVDNLNITERNIGGFGSTNTKKI